MQKSMFILCSEATRYDIEGDQVCQYFNKLESLKAQLVQNYHRVTLPDQVLELQG